VADDRGELVGWAAVGDEEREDIDGEEDLITYVKIASHKGDRSESGFVRGYLVLFVKQIEAGMWSRVGMGEITKTVWFDNMMPGSVMIV
jgi:hypothetical protein